MTLKLLDLTASFSDVEDPTPFGIYDSDVAFSSSADGLVKLVNSTLGGNILQVEITNKDVYACLEQSVLEYSGMINSYQAKSMLADLIGSETGSLEGKENLKSNPRGNLLTSVFSNRFLCISIFIFIFSLKKANMSSFS